MSKIILPIEQYSQEWFNSRRGKFTSSNIWNLMVEPKEKTKKDNGELSQTSKDYVMQKLSERLTGIKREFNNEATAYGVEYEPKAIAVYELHSGNKVDPTGYIECIENIYGGTPDGLVGTDGSIQVKCPFEPKNHLYFCLTESVEHFKRKYREYYWQVQSDMFVSDRQWCDFISYCPYMPSGKELWVMRIQRNDEDVQKLCDAIGLAYRYMMEVMEKLNKSF